VSSDVTPASASMKADPLRRIRRVDRNVGASGFQDARMPVTISSERRRITRRAHPANPIP